MKRQALNHLIRVTAAMAMLCAAGPGAAAAPPQYDLVDAGACARPLKRAPPQRKEGGDAYRVERRFLDLDGSGQCVLMDVWIARLGGSDSPGMRTLEHRLLRFSGGKWRRFEASLDYFPHVLRARADNALFLVVAPTEEELGDSMLAGAGPSVLTVAGWTDGGAWLDLQPAGERGEDVLRALAAASAAKARAR